MCVCVCVRVCVYWYLLLFVIALQAPQIDSSLDLHIKKHGLQEWWPKGGI